MVIVFWSKSRRGKSLREPGLVRECTVCVDHVWARELCVVRIMWEYAGEFGSGPHRLSEPVSMLEPESVSSMCVYSLGELWCRYGFTSLLLSVLTCKSLCMRY